MTRYLTLIEYTDHGIRDVKDSVYRAAQFRASVEAVGGKILGLYWALGEIDGAVLFEVADDATAAGLMLRLARDGFVRTRSIRVFDAAEFEQVVGKMPT